MFHIALNLGFWALVCAFLKADIEFQSKDYENESLGVFSSLINPIIKISS
jgi:hypothetical protein